MMVETYECEETASESVEISEEAKALIDKLGLEGQQAMLKPSDDGTRRVPYRKMTADEYFVYRTLCPSDTTLKKYADGPIPLRVLQVAAHADSLDFFDEVHVWARESADIKDPVLVGKKKSGYDYEFYLLARWGEALDEWPALTKAALVAWKSKMKGQLGEILSEINGFLAGLDAVDFTSAVKRRNNDPKLYGLS